MLPAIERYIIRRPGVNVPRHQFVANPEEGVFWNYFYRRCSVVVLFIPAVEDFEKYINPYFGYFGMRWHPVVSRPNYFHIGVDVNVPFDTPVCAVADGVLEYSGFADVNGNYVVLRHPGICTEDGFELKSLYLHCKALHVGFSFTQKLIRECISTKLEIANVAIGGGGDC